MNLFIMSFKSSEANEKAKLPGDTALYKILSIIARKGYNIEKCEVAFLPDDSPVNLERRRKALKSAEASDQILIFGSDTVRAIKNWFPTDKAIVFPQAYFFIQDPGRIELQILQKLRSIEEEQTLLLGLSDNKTIGGIL